MAQLNDEALRAYAAAGEMVRAVKGRLGARVSAGAGRLELATFVEDEIVRLGGRPAFPCNISVNQIASHSTPTPDDRRTLAQGDLVKFDLGAIVDGYIADSAITLAVETDDYAHLIRAAEQALADALAVVRPGVGVGEIGQVIEASARKNGYRVLKGLYGHSLERDCLHGGLTIPNYDDGSHKKIREGDVIAIEPFLTSGSGEVLRQSGGDIFQLVRRSGLLTGEREKKLLSCIERNYNGFPFARRWLPDPDALEGLLGPAIVMEFPMLVEKDGARVAQAEHTAIVGGDGCTIIT
jgi:methionyl aminopeptidase